MWKSVLDSALQAAERAGEAAKELTKKGLEIADPYVGEASKKLKDLGITDQLKEGPAPPPPQEDLEAFGITPEFVDFVRTLNYSTFRDFPLDQLPPLNVSAATAASSSSATTSGGGGEPAAPPAAGAAAAAGGAPAAAAEAAHVLNPWQVRHATLVVRAVKEVDELRFVLCPRYLTDELFWHIFFTLVRRHLPEKAFSWGPSDVLPPTKEAAAGGAAEPFSLSSLSKQLRQLSSKLQPPPGTLGLELAPLGSGSAAGVSVASGAASGASGAAAAAAAEPLPHQRRAEGLLENDPDLEAYLQVAINDTKGSEDEEEESDGEELDLDSLMAQLEEEEEEAEGAGGAEDKQQQQEAAAAAGNHSAAAEEGKKQE